MDNNFQPAGMLGDQEDSDLEYMDFGDSIKAHRPQAAHNFPQYVPKHTGGFGVPEKKTNGNVKEHSNEGRTSKARQRKKRASALQTDAMAQDNFRVACSRGNLEELRTHLINGKQCQNAIFTKGLCLILLMAINSRILWNYHA